MSEHLELAASIARLLERLQIEYVIGGSVASSILGEPRSTIDIDVAVSLTEEQLGRLLAEVVPTFYVPVADAARAVDECDAFNAIHSELALKVDFFVLGADVLDRNQLARRIKVELPTNPASEVFVTAVEDQVLRKLDWSRMSESDRQRRDVIALLRLNAEDLDYGYLEATASESGLEDLVADALTEASRFAPVEHVNLIVEGAEGGTQPVEVRRRSPRTYLVAHSPGLVEGLAAGDVISLPKDSDGAFQVLQRGGNLAIKWASTSSITSQLDQADALLGQVGGRLDGSIDKAAVWTIPVSAGFARVESVMGEVCSLVEGSDWWYGNVYDANSNPLNWWIDL